MITYPGTFNRKSVRSDNHDCRFTNKSSNSNNLIDLYPRPYRDGRLSRSSSHRTNILHFLLLGLVIPDSNAYTQVPPSPNRPRLLPNRILCERSPPLHMHTCTLATHCMRMPRLHTRPMKTEENTRRPNQAVGWMIKG